MLNSLNNINNIYQKKICFYSLAILQFNNLFFTTLNKNFFNLTRKKKTNIYLISF